MLSESFIFKENKKNFDDVKLAIETIRSVNDVSVWKKKLFWLDLHKDNIKLFLS